MLKWVLIFSLTSLVLACTGQLSVDSTSGEITDRNDRGIVGGELVDAADDKAKMVVLIRGLQQVTEVQDDGETVTKYKFDVCTGSFISDNIILTAAHCHFKDPYKTSIVYSTDIHDFDAPASEIDQFIVHDDYKDSEVLSEEKADNDIALIKIKGTKPADYKILKLTKVPDHIHSFAITSIGYGRTTGIKPAQELALQGLGQLRSTPATVKSFTAAKNYFLVDQSQGHGVCVGDSGGPAIMTKDNKSYVIGVATSIPKTDVQFNEDDDVCKHESAYINVQYYADWITKTIQILQ